MLVASQDVGLPSHHLEMCPSKATFGGCGNGAVEHANLLQILGDFLLQGTVNR